MKTFNYTIIDELGIHARPAGMLVKTAKELGSNMANYERLIRELPIFSQVITMPIVVIGFDGTEGEQWA